MNRVAVFVTATLLTGAGLAAGPRVDVSSPEMLPENTMELLAAPSVPGEKGALTTVLVDIDPLGATEPVPWTVHSVPHLNVRTGPSVNNADIGDLPTNTAVQGDYYLALESDEEWLNFTFENNSRWSSVTGLTRPHPSNVENIALHGNLPIGHEIVNRWWGIPISYEPDDLVTIPSSYAGGQTTRRLRAEPLTHAMAMIDAMRLDGLDMFISSPYRSGPTQKNIYDGNVANSGLNQRFSAPPGHSEHQLGTTIDFARPGGGFLRNTDPQHAWMVDNAAGFGFRQTYTGDNTDETGYIEEPWHWRYLGTDFTETSYNAWLID